MQKLYLICTINTNSLSNAVNYLLIQNRTLLEEHNIIYNPNYYKIYDAYTHVPLTNYLASYKNALELNQEEKIIADLHILMMDELGVLERDLAKGKDVLCCLRGQLYQSLELFFKTIKKFPHLSKCEIHPIFSLTTAQANMHNLLHLTWKKMSFEEMYESMLNVHFLQKSDEIHAILTKYCSKENIHTVFHDGYAPYKLDVCVVEEIFNIMQVPLSITQDELNAKNAFPRSSTGLNLWHIFKDFPFYLYRDEGLSKDAFFLNLQQTEQQANIPPIDFTLHNYSKKLDKSCEPAFANLAKALGRTTLFEKNYDLKQLAEAPNPLPITGKEEYSIFIQNFQENWLVPMLCYFRDLSILNPEQEVFAKALEDHRAKNQPHLNFTYPRPEPLLTVITTCFNHEKYIEDCIKSVIDQKCDFPIEHIIVDDTSSDASVDIITKYAGQYPHIRPIYLKYRSGFLTAKNAFDICKSKYVALCDGDDFFTDPLKLQKQVDLLEKNPDYSLCFHPVSVQYEDGTNRDSIYPNPESLPRGVRSFYYLADLLKCNFIQTNTVVYRWRFRDGMPSWFRTDVVPSDWYWHLLHAETGKIGFINEIMSTYRRHVESFYYGSEHVVEHRLKHGMDELNTYNAINDHFGGKYQTLITKLTDGVFSSFLNHYLATKDDTYLHQASEIYPHFAKVFLNSIKTSHHKN